MKALILVGGFGTRLRPLTFSKPKPLVEFCNEPMIMHQIRALASVGVTDIVLAVNYQPQTMTKAMERVSQELGVKIHFSIEEEPLGTAGPLALAKDLLKGENGEEETFFVLNSDVICEFPFKRLLDFHTSHGCEGTLATTPVQDPSKYGVILLHDGTTKIDKFVEKPQTFVGNQINAGIYIFNSKVLDRIQPIPTSIEKEIFPDMAKQGQLHATPLEGFWADVGQPKDFLTGTGLFLEALAKETKTLSTNGKSHLVTLNESKDNDFTILGNVFIHETAKIGKGATLGPNVSIGANTIVGDGSRIRGSVLLDGARVGNQAYVRDSIVGWGSSVGNWARVEGISVLGEDVHLSSEIYVNNTSVLPHKSVSASIATGKIVM